MILQALRDDVIVKPLYETKKSAIIIPQSAVKYKKYDGQVRAEVISVGKNYPYDELKQGDRIVFQKEEGVKFVYQGETYLKLKSRWVQCLDNG